MRALIITGLIIVAAVVASLIMPPWYGLPECANEDEGVLCVWHADRQGNGTGESFWYDHRGDIHYI